MSDLDDLSIFEMFRMEAEEQVDALEKRLLALREGDSNDAVLRGLMRGAHSLKGAARVVGLQAVVGLTHAMEERFVAAQGGRAIAQGELDDLLRSIDLLRAVSTIEEIQADAWSAAHQSSIDALSAAFMGGASSSEEIAAAQPAPSDSPQPEYLPAGAAPEAAPPPSAEMNLRITAQRFDRIIAMASDNLVQAQQLVRVQGQMRSAQRKLERLVSQARDAQQAGQQMPPVLRSILEHGERQRFALGGLIHELDHLVHTHELNAERLQREVLFARLRPFSEVVPNLRRLVRDLAGEMGKRVSLEVTGERTEVDRDILERLRAPLEHLLRNALDHGVETPAERASAGKPDTGIIRLQAGHANGRLSITLSDDGRGADAAAIARRAVQRGLVRADVASRLSEAEVLEFLFLPGFSTRTEVTEISGRGFGLDVVQSMVHEAGGSVRIETNPGQGTRFHLVLPVTRSLLRVMRIEAEGEIYAVPLHRISRVAAAHVETADDSGSTAMVGEQRFPVIHIMDALQSGGAAVHPGHSTVMFLLNDKGHEAPIAFQLDRVVDETTVSVRQLDPRLGRMAAIAAVTLTEQNVPMLIVEPDDVLRLAEQAQTRGSRAERRQHSGESARGSVLVVDDSGTVRQMLRRTLLRAGYSVSTAEHGAEAWNLLQTSSFDLLVSDVDMPEMNGIELVEHVRGNVRLETMPVILLSYKGREEDRQRGLEAGADAYVTKGEFQEAAFLQIVTDLVGPAELPEASA